MDKPTSPVSYALPHIGRLEAYVPGTQPEGTGWIKLNTNENPYPPGPAVAEAIHAEMGRLPLYPNPTSAALREAIAKANGVAPGQVIAGNGSDDILNLLARCFCDKDNPAGTMDPNYSLYPVLTDIQNAKIKRIPYDRDMTLDAGKIAGSGANIFFFSSPNAPTGVGYMNEQIRLAVESFEGILVVDEAYGAFAEENAVPLLKEFANLVITRTFSKSHGLAGLRVGYALAAPEVIGILDRVRDSYNVNRLSQAGALGALSEPEYYAASIAKIKATRDRFRKELETRGWFTYPSQSNFIFTRPAKENGSSGPDAAEGLFHYLRERKILVRHFADSALTASFLRISVGTDAHMEALLEAIDLWRNHA